MSIRHKYWGLYWCSFHVKERSSERLLKEMFGMEALKKDFIKHVKWKRYRESKDDYVVIGKLAIYFISGDDACIRTILQKTKRAIHGVNRFL